MNALRGVGAPLTKFVIFAVITVLCTMVLASTIANSTGKAGTDYNARFVDATGLLTGDEVRIAGVRVGQVEEISLVDRKVALVRFSVDEGMRLPRSTMATIKFRNLIGQRYLSLSQGPAAPGEVLAEGATLPLEQTRPALNLTQLFAGFRPLLQALSPEDVNKLSYELVTVLQGEGGTISSLLSHTASLSSTLADKDQVIGSVIDNLNLVLDTVNERDTEFTQLIVTVRELVSGLSQDRDSIGDAVESIGELTDVTADLLSDARPPLEDDIRHLGDLAANLNDNEELVQRFFDTAPRKLDLLIPLGTYAGWFNFYLCGIGGTLTLPPPLDVLGPQEVELPPGLPPIGTDPRCDGDADPASYPLPMTGGN